MVFLGADMMRGRSPEMRMGTVLGVNWLYGPGLLAETFIGGSNVLAASIYTAMVAKPWVIGRRTKTTTQTNTGRVLAVLLNTNASTFASLSVQQYVHLCVARGIVDWVGFCLLCVRCV